MTQENRASGQDGRPAASADSNPRGANDNANGGRTAGPSKSAPVAGEDASWETALWAHNLGLHFMPLPRGKKKPPPAGWQGQRPTTADAARFKDESLNIAVGLGDHSGGLVDVDLDWDKAAYWADLILGKAPAFGHPSKLRSHRLIRSVGASTRKFALPGSLNDPRLPNEHALCVVEIRSNGSYTVFPGSTHEGSGEPIAWHDVEPPAQLPEMDAASLNRRVGLVAFMSYLDQFFPPLGVRCDFMMAVAGALAHAGYDADRIQSLVQALGERHGDKGNGGQWQVAAARGPNRVNNDLPVTGVPTIVKILGHPEAVAETLTSWLGEIKQEEQAQAPIKVVDLTDFDPASLPERSWRVPGLLLNGACTLLFAKPGLSKSTDTLHVAVSCASGKPWGGHTPNGSCNVLIINAEDDHDEMRRRIVGACEAVGCTLDDIKGRLHTLDVDSISLVEMDPESGEFRSTHLLHELNRICGELSIGVLVFDPLVEGFVGIDENSAYMKEPVIRLRGLARSNNLAVYLAHHSSKQGSNNGGSDQYNSRGSSAIPAACRIAYEMRGMTFAEATANLGSGREEERWSYIRKQSVKQNYARNGCGEWLHVESTNVGNGTGMEGAETEPDSGDSVAVLRLARFDREAVDPQTWACREEFLAAVRRGRDQEGRPYATSGETKSSIYGLLASRFGVRTARARALVQAYVDAKVLWFDPSCRNTARSAYTGVRVVDEQIALTDEHGRPVI